MESTVWLALLVCALSPSTMAQELDHAETDRLAVQYLAEPPRRDIRADLAVFPARLTYEQRLALEVRVDVPLGALQAGSVHRDLYVVLKAGHGEQWAANGSYTHRELTQKVERHQTIEFTSRLYVRPGRWDIGIVLYDAVTKQHTVLRKTVKVTPLKNDPLPQLDSGLPDVEFGNGEDASLPAASGSPAPQVDASVRQPRFGERPPRFPQRLPTSQGAAPAAIAADDSTDTSDPTREVELQLRRPVELDLLVDFTPSDVHSGSSRMLRRTESVFWAITRVLTELRSPNLCVRVTGVDVVGMRTLFYRMDGADMDWETVAEELEKLDANTVPVETLERRKQSATFFRSAVEDLMGVEDSSCGPAQRVYVIASSGILFPPGTASKPIEHSPATLYYLRVSLLPGYDWDAMEKIVKPLHPRMLDIHDPLQFRKAVGEMVRDWEAMAR